MFNFLYLSLQRLKIRLLFCYQFYLVLMFFDLLQYLYILLFIEPHSLFQFILLVLKSVAIFFKEFYYLLENYIVKHFQVLINFENMSVEVF